MLTGVEKATSEQLVRTAKAGGASSPAQLLLLAEPFDVTAVPHRPLLGMPVDHPLTLWLFSAVTLAAVGLSALTVFAVFGSVGALANMLFFVALAMTSSGGTVPLEATPAFFHWISTFEPMHAIVEGTESILYFDATSGSGLTEAWLHVGVGGMVGVLLGLALTSRFDLSPKLIRHPPSDPADEPDVARRTDGEINAN